ncbi:hypothetical protein [Bradyrhizobium genosp. P]|uniref:hypothetical protein n=1 Tax=Bradyrhizobium genosp. P TaxID=83641 RepID=UPI003CEDF66E
MTDELHELIDDRLPPFGGLSFEAVLDDFGAVTVAPEGLHDVDLHDGKLGRALQFLAVLEISFQRRPLEIVEGAVPGPTLRAAAKVFAFLLGARR